MPERMNTVLNCILRSKGKDQQSSIHRKPVAADLLTVCCLPRRKALRRLVGAVVAAVLGCDVLIVSGAESVREQEIRECRSGEIATWGDGLDRPAISSKLSFSYKPANAPAEFSPTLVAGMVAKAAAEWSKCGVSVDVLVWVDGARPAPDVVVVQWSGKGSAGNFGLADLGKRTLSLGRSAFELLRTRNPTHDTRETLQMVISHEMGHFFGLMAHSRRCVDVLSYYHDAKGEKCFSRDPSQVRAVTEYRHVLPTACDIERCRAANGMLPR